MGKDQETKDGDKSDSSSHFFIHHYDHPGMVITSKPLNGNNYATWCRSIIISLSAKNKFGFVDGTVKMPSAKTHPDDFSLWKCCNNMVLSWLLNTLEPDIADSVIYSTTAHEIL